MDGRNHISMRQLKMHLVLKRLLADKNISARELARACAIPQSTITSFLSGRDMHRPDQVFAVAKYFDISMEELLFGEDSRPPTLSNVATMDVFEGWLKVRIEKAIPDKKKTNNEED